MKNIVMELPKKNGEMFHVTAMYYRELVEKHRGVDVLYQLQKMRNWCDANPRKRKVDIPRFINSWLSRPGVERDVSRGTVSAVQSRHVAVVVERESASEPYVRPPESVVAAEVSAARAMLRVDEPEAEASRRERCQHEWRNAVYTWTQMCWRCGMFADQVLSQDFDEMIRIAQSRRG